VGEKVKGGLDMLVKSGWVRWLLVGLMGAAVATAIGYDLRAGYIDGVRAARADGVQMAAKQWPSITESRRFLHRVGFGFGRRLELRRRERAEAKAAGQGIKR
jgi:hypothetical protein